MIRSLLILLLAVPAFAATPDEIRIAMAMERERHKHQEPKVVIPAPEPAPIAANIFADYPADKLRAALQPPPAQPVARAVRPNQGSCVCNRTGGDCLCQPASLCAQGRCPALTQLRAVEVPYYFPNPTYCPPGRP